MAVTRNQYSPKSSKFRLCFNLKPVRPPWDQTQHVGNERHDAPPLLRVESVHHRSAILAVEPFDRSGCGVFDAFAHEGTLGTVEMIPFLLSLKLYLYSPRLIRCVTLVT